MVSDELISKIRAISEEPLKKLGISIYHLEFVQEGKENFLRFLIDKIDGTVDLDLCVEVSKVLSALLDKHDPIDSEYTLEVSSSGAEKPLLNEEHFREALGKNVHFYLDKTVQNQDEIEGKLLRILDDSYDLEVKVKTVIKIVNIKKSAITYARLAVSF